MSKYCTNCGKELPDNANFCDNCGTRFNTSAYQEPIPKKKSSFGSKILIFLLIAAFLFVAGFGLLVFLERIYHRIPPEPVPSHVEETVETKEPEDIPVVIQDDLKEEPVDTPEETPVTNETDVSQGMLMPDGNPRFDEFLFYENDVYYNGIPEGAFIQSAGSIYGQWKYCFTFNRTFEDEERIDEIGLADVSFDGDTASLILHPQQIRYGSDVSAENEEEVGYPLLSGSWDNESVDLEADGIAVSFSNFYAYQDKEYVLGNIIVKETGMFGDVLLVRP